MGSSIMNGIILMAVGAGVLAAGICILVVASRKKKRCTAETLGTIVDFDRQREENGPENPVPIVEFTVEDKAYRLRASASASGKEAKVGEAMQVHFDPAKPEYAYTAEFSSSMTIGGIAMAAIGAVSMVIGVILLI